MYAETQRYYDKYQQHPYQSREVVPFHYQRQERRRRRHTTHEGPAQVEVTKNNKIEVLPIDSTFPVEPEIQFRRRNREKGEYAADYLTNGQVDFYQKEQMITFLCEFAGKIPFKAIPGILGEDMRLKICNMDILEMAEHAYAITGPGTREESELAGLQSIMQAFSRGHTDAHMVSPPKIADYMLTFSFKVGEYDPTLNGRPVREIVTNKPEDMATLDTSRGIFNTLARQAATGQLSDSFRSANEFIAAPITYSSNDPHSLTRSLEAMGTTPENIAFSEEYEHRVRSLLGSEIADYLKLLETASTLTEDSPLYAPLKTRLEQKRDSIFSFAKGIAQELRAENEPTEQDIPHMRVADIMQMRDTDPYAYAIMAQQIQSLHPAMITGGTSCPSLSEKSTMSTLQAFAQNGYTMDGMLHAMEGMYWKDVITIRCPDCRSTRTYHRVNVEKAGALHCSGSKDGSPCTNSSDCWEPFFIAKKPPTKLALVA